MRKIFTLCMLLTSMAIFSSCGGTSSPGDVAGKYVEYIQNKEYLTFTQELYKTPAEREDAVKLKENEAQFALLIEKAGQEIEKKGGIKDYVVISETISEDGKTAKVVVNQIYGNGEEKEDLFDMILDENGDWRLTMKK